MTVATARLTFEEFLALDDGTGARYELVDGVLVEMGTENALNLSIAFALGVIFNQLGIPAYLIGAKHLLAVSSTKVTARDPDLTVHTEASYASVATKKQSFLSYNAPLPLLVVEVVSEGEPGEKNYDRDYVEKPKEYADRGIPEFWIVDPIRQVVWVLTLSGDTYRRIKFSGRRAIVSPTFPNLKLTAAQVLSAGRLP
jgi:Uma2 family endonuclease